MVLGCWVFFLVWVVEICGVGWCGVVGGLLMRSMMRHFFFLLALGFFVSVWFDFLGVCVCVCHSHSLRGDA